MARSLRIQHKGSRYHAPDRAATFSRDGYTWTKRVTTGLDGVFTYAYRLSDGEPAGLIEVWASSSDTATRPDVVRSFVVRSVYVTHSSADLHMPRNYTQDFIVRVLGVTSSDLTGLRVELVGDAPAGLSVNLPASVTLTSGRQVDLTVGFTGRTAQGGDFDSGDVTLRVVSDDPDNAGASVEWAGIPVRYAFVDASGWIEVSPMPARLGVTPGGDDFAELTITNKGYAALDDITVRLVPLNEGDTVPSWIRLPGGDTLGSLEIGASLRLQIAALAPSAPVSVDQDFWCYARITAPGLAQPYDVPVQVTLTPSGVGSASFKVTDAYYQFVYSDGAPNPSFEGVPEAGVRIEKENASGASALTQTVATDARGEVYFSELPAGRYRVTVTADKHDVWRGTLIVRPGVVSAQEVFLNYNPVTITWSVMPTTIDDKYDIVVDAVFETHVPVPVVVANPTYIRIPDDIQPGQSFHTSYTLTNHGLIRAKNLWIDPPQNDAYFTYEMTPIGRDYLEAGETIRVFLTATAVKVPWAAASASPASPASPVAAAESGGAARMSMMRSGGAVVAAAAGSASANANAGGGGGLAYMADSPHGYDYDCSSGITGSGGGSIYLGGGGSGYNSSDDNDDNGNKPGGPQPPKPPPPPPSNPHTGTGSGNNNNRNGGGNNGGWNDGDGTIEGGESPCFNGPPQPPPCGPEEPEDPTDPKDECEKDDDDDDPTDDCEQVGSWVGLVTRQYEDHAVDLSIPIPGGAFKLQREYAWRRWSLRAASTLEVLASALSGPYPVINDVAYYADGTAPRSPSPLLEADGVTPQRLPLSELPVGVYKFRQHSVIKQADGTAVWRASSGYEQRFDAEGRHIASYSREQLVAAFHYEDVQNTNRLTRVSDRNSRTILMFAETETPDSNIEQQVSDFTGRTMRYTWKDGRLLKIELLASASAIEAVATTTYEYGRYGEITRRVDPNGAVETITYTENPTSAYEDAPVFPVTGPANQNFFPMQVKTLTDGTGGTTRFAYRYESATDGYYAAVTSPEGVVTEKWFNPDGSMRDRAVAGVNAFSYRETDGIATVKSRGRYYAEELDSRGNPILRVFEDGTSEKITYDPRYNKRSSFTDRDGVKTVWTYDSFGNTAAYTEAAGTELERTTRYEYIPGTRLLAKEIDALGRETIYSYDNNDFLIEVVAPGGVRTTYTRDTLGHALTETDALGRTTTRQYDVQDRVIREIDASGLITEYRYTGDNLTEMERGSGSGGADGSPVVFTESRITRHTYDAQSRRIATYQVDSVGVAHLVSATDYDRDGRIIRERGPLGTVAEYAYDDAGRPAVVSRPTPAGGMLEEISTHDDNGRVIAIDYNLRAASGTDGANEAAATVLPASIHQTYDAEGRLLSRVEATDTDLERYTRYTYDIMSRVLTETKGAPGALEQRVTGYAYDKLGRQTSATLNGEQTGSIPTHDALDRATSETDALGNVTTYTYDDAGRVTETKLNGRTISTVTYDAIGQPVTSADALGNHTHIRHDALGRATHQSITFAPGETVPDNWWTQPKYILVETEYNSFSETVSQKRPTVAPDNTVTYAITTTTYNELGRVITTTTPTGLVQQYQYDSAGQPVQIIRPAADGTNLEVGEITEYHPTLSGIVLAQIDATGGRTEYTHDALGRAIAIKTPLGGTVTNIYDALGRVISSETHDASSAVVASTSMTYDHFDQPLVTTHADGSTEISRYDSQGHLIEKGGNATYPLRYTYDALDRMATMTDGNNNTTTWAYNDLGQIETKTYADGSIWRYTYTDTGQLATRTWARTRTDGQPFVTTYAYTTAGQLSSVTYNDGTTPSVAFTYDQQGRRLSMITGSTPGSAGISARDAITTDNIYDPAGRLIAINDGTQTLAYTYNAYGQRLSMSVSGTSTSTLKLNYNYDATGRLTTVANGDQIHRYTYHPGTSQLATRTSGNVTTTYAYDTGRGMLTSIENKAGSTVVSKYAYTINKRGQRTQVSQSGAAFATPSGYGWFYNTKGEVIAANHTTDTTKNRAYNYDPIGNRLWSTEGNPTTDAQPESPDPLAAAISEYTSNNLNQYTSVTSAPSVVKTPTYDLDGNMTDTGSGSTYAWDAENRLIRVTKTDGTEVCYAYDGESRRIMREVYKNSVLQSATRYLYDGWNVIAEFDALSSDLRPMSSYIWGLDLSDSLQDAGGVGGLLSKTDHTSTLNLIYTYDGNGNVSELIATDNSIAAHYEYDAFGKTITKQGSYADANVYRFSTKSLDVESELYYYGYRFYNLQLGRWPNRDPIEEEGGVNLYGIVENDPIASVDILGLDGDPDSGFGNPFSCQRQLIRTQLQIPPAVLSIARRVGIYSLKIKVNGQYQRCQGCCKSTNTYGQSKSGSIGMLGELEVGTQKIDLKVVSLRIGWYGRLGASGNVNFSYNKCSKSYSGGGCVNLYGELGGIASVEANIFSKIEAGGRLGLNVRGTLCVNCDSNGCVVRARACAGIRGRIWVKASIKNRNWEYGYEPQVNTCSRWVDIMRL